MGDASAALVERVKEAVESKTGFNIVGGASKPFGTPLIAGNGTDVPSTTQPGDDTARAQVSTLEHSGVINYDPTELVISVRSGTRLSDLTQALADENQMLPFEPPMFDGGSIGGVLACGLSGPRRPWMGSARDYVLGTRVINGLGQDLAFGGEVMKNVAGYDVSRLQVGAFGTLGLLLDVSMKVLPRPELEVTLVEQLEVANDVSSLIALARQPLPISATMVIGNQRYVRLGGSALAVESTAATLGGERLDPVDSPWASVRDLQHDFFTRDKRPLWRISVADHAAPISIEGNWLMEWGGAQRWLKSDAPAAEVFAASSASGGHATRYGHTDSNQNVFQPLEGPMRKLQARVRSSFDPDRLFNPGRFHPEIDTH